MTGRLSKVLSRNPNVYFLTIKFKKSLEETKDPGTS